MLFKRRGILPLLGILTSASTLSFSIVAQAQLPNIGDSPGTPPNNGVDGGDLSPTEACSEENPLAALIPNDNPVYPGQPLFTTSANPVLFFYVPYENEEVRYGEFTIHEYEAPHDRERLYGGRFELPQTPGIVSLSIPEALKTDQNYRWRFKLHCTGNQTLVSSGYVRRLDSTPESESSIREGELDVWYDVMAALANSLSSSENSDDRENWDKLITYIESDELDIDVLTPDLLVGPVRPTGN